MDTAPSHPAPTHADAPPPPPLAGVTPASLAAMAQARTVEQAARLGPLLDPGWLFLLAGIALLSATVLLPAQQDLEDVRFYLRRAQTAEQHRLARMENYTRYLGDLQRGDEVTVRSLAAMQLNQAPQGTELLVPSGELPQRTASVFANLEPPPLVLPEKPVRDRSILEQWATDNRARLWLMAAGALCLLIGLLPPSRPRA